MKHHAINLVFSQEEGAETRRHDYFVVLINLAGALSIDIANETFILEKGSAFKINPHTSYKITTPSHAYYLSLETRDQCWASLGRFPQNHILIERLAVFLEYLSHHDRKTAEIFGPLLLINTWKLEELHPSAVRPIDWNHLNNWILENLNKRVSVEDLAEKACLSVSQFRLRCRKELGLSPSEWVRRIRYIKAMALRKQGAAVHQIKAVTGLQSDNSVKALMNESCGSRHKFA